MKKRAFEFDFARAIATILIVITHFNARYMFIGTKEAYSKMIGGISTFNIYIGGLGVSLFLIISGWSMMQAYGENFNLKIFWKKRFLSIYPMFWIAYIVAFFHQFYVYRAINRSIPKWSIILSILGIDGYLSNANIPTFYILGEWFLGFIIVFYIIFPILRKGVLNHPIYTVCITVALYVFSTTHYTINFPSNMFLFVRLPELLFGMIFQRYIKKVNCRMVILSVIILILNTIFAPTYSTDIQTTYVGITSFIILLYIGNLLKERRIIFKICQIMCKYSYAIFLVHHYIIAYMMGKFDLNNISILESWILFLMICCLIALFAKLLYESNRCAVKNWLRFKG